MKTMTSLCALTLMAGLFAASASAEAVSYIPHQSTIPRLANQAEVIVVGRLARVENIQLGEAGIDFAMYPNRGTPARQDGESGFRREAVITVSQTLKGASHVTGSELRVVSMRQLKFDNYDADLRGGEALFFCSPRSQDNRLIVLSDERGAITAEDNAGNLTGAVEMARRFLTVGRFADLKPALLAGLTLNGGRVSLDACVELAWNWEDYAAVMTPADKQLVLDKAKEATPGTEERVQLIHAVGRHKPDGAMNDLLGMIMSDSQFTTTSIACWAMENIERREAVNLFVGAFASANASQRVLLVRALGLIHPKDWFEGAEVRQAACDCVAALLVAGDETALREALIAARNMWAGKELKAQLKNLIENRAHNGISEEAVKGAIVALATHRTKTEQMGKTIEAVHERGYLNNLATQDPALKQVVDCAILFPYSTLITDTEGRLR